MDDSRETLWPVYLLLGLIAALWLMQDSTDDSAVVVATETDSASGNGERQQRQDHSVRKRRVPIKGANSAGDTNAGNTDESVTPESPTLTPVTTEET